MSGRLRALLAKEVADLGRSPGVFVPAILTAGMTVAMPLVVALLVPALTGEPLANSADFRAAVETLGAGAWVRALGPEGAVQAFIFQQFLVLLVLGPVAASMSTAAFSVIGDKQARTLEPLLATPITTLELIGAKILGAFAPALALTLASFVARAATTAVLAQPGVYRVLLTPSALVIVFGVGPLAALAALQMAVCVSSRVNDARSAQQIGALLILPVAGLLVAQVAGAVVLTAGLALAIAGGLIVLNGALLRLAIALFQRETILTRWT